MRVIESFITLLKERLRIDRIATRSEVLAWAREGGINTTGTASRYLSFLYHAEYFERKAVGVYAAASALFEHPTKTIVEIVADARKTGSSGGSKAKAFKRAFDDREVRVVDDSPCVFGNAYLTAEEQAQLAGLDVRDILNGVRRSALNAGKILAVLRLAEERVREGSLFGSKKPRE